MRVGKVAGYEDLMGLHFAQEVAYDLHVYFRQGTFLNAARLVEGQVEEVAVVEEDVIVSTCRAGFAAAYQAFDGQDVARVDVAVFLLLQELAYLGVFVGDHLVFAVVEELVEAVDKMEEADDLFVAYL